MLSMLDKKVVDGVLKCMLLFFFIVSQKIGLHILCKLTMETGCMKCQPLFSEEK